MKNVIKVLGAAALIAGFCPYRITTDAATGHKKIRVKGESGRNYLPHTLNNTVVAPPRMLIAFLENNLQADGSVKIPAALRPYMGGKDVIVPKH